MAFMYHLSRTNTVYTDAVRDLDVGSLCTVSGHSICSLKKDRLTTKQPVSRSLLLHWILSTLDFLGEKTSTSKGTHLLLHMPPFCSGLSQSTSALVLSLRSLLARQHA